DVTFDESVPYYRLFPYRTAPLLPPPLFLTPVDAVEPVKVAVDSGTSGGAEPECEEPEGAGSGGAEPERAELGGAGSGGAELGVAESGGAEPAGAGPGGPSGALSRRELPSPQELCEWFARRWSHAAGAGGTAGAGGSASAGGAGATGPGGARTGGTGAAGRGGATGARATGGDGAGGAAGVGATGGTGSRATESSGGPAGAGAAGGTGAGGAAGAGALVGAGIGATGAAGGVTGPGGASGVGADAWETGAVSAGSGGAARPRPYFVPLLKQVASPLPAPSPYTGPTGALAERREPESRPASPVRTAHTSHRAPCLRPPAVPCTHQMALRPSTAPQRVPLPSPPASTLPALADPVSDSLRAASPTVTRFLATSVTDPSFESATASALVAELVDFAAHCRLDYAASLVAESASVCPPSFGGECALNTDVLEDRQEEFQCFAAALPHLVSTLLAPEGDPDAPDILTPRSYAEAIEGPYSSQWVKRSPGSPPVFKARYVARGFRQRQGVDYFQTFSPTPKMTTLRVLLHVAAQRDYELHSLDFSTAFLQGSLHEEICLRRPPGFIGSFPPGAQWSLRRPVYGLRQVPREWHDTLRTTLAALEFAPSTADPSLFLRTDTLLPPFYILVYVDDLVFATADTAGLAHVKSELQKRHTFTDLGELRSNLGLQITRDRAQRTITLTQSHMVQQVLQRFDFTYSSPQAIPLSTRHSLSALPSDESVEPSGPYPELVGCLMYLMTCTRPDLAYPLSILARYVAPGRHRQEHMAAAKRVLRYLCSTSGMGLVLGGRSPVVLTGHADASWVDDLATQRSSQGRHVAVYPLVFCSQLQLDLQKLVCYADVVVSCHENGWMDANGVIQWLDECVKPFLKPGFGRHARSSMVVLDSYRGHLTDAVKEKFRELNCVPAIIPAGCTAEIQPLDVSINKSFKACVRQQYQKWFQEEGQEQLTKAGNLKKPPPEVVVRWISRAWKAVPADLIKRAFLTCGISNALDGSEDCLAMAHRRSQLTAEVDVDDSIIADGFFGNNCQEPESDEEE
ncbi:unnamed protein product, partial [Closterium sp. NIES-54]